MKKILYPILLTGALTQIQAWTWNGDVRARGDWAYTQETSDTAKFYPNNERFLQSARARLGLEFGESFWTAGLRVVTGLGMPNTQNQALDNGGIGKVTSVDRAYIKFEFNQVPLLGDLQTQIGKMASPFIRGKANAEMIWHQDWAPEGGHIQLERSIGPVDITLAAGQFWLDELESERLNKGETFIADHFMRTAQASLEFEEGPATVRITGGTHVYDKLKGHVALGLDTTKFNGNTTTTRTDKARLYATDFDLIEGNADLTLTFGKIPLTMSYGYVLNQSAPVDNDAYGYMFGGKIGKAKKAWTGELGAAYRRLGADAILGVTSSSDLSNYSTNSTGYLVNFKLMLTDNLSWDLIGHLGNTIGINDAYKGKEQKFNRIRTELNAKF